MSNKKQTAFSQYVNDTLRGEAKEVSYYLELEKQQIELTAIKCHFEGVRQKAKTSEQYIEYGEQYYRETYEL
jgi:hypothetical protein